MIKKTEPDTQVSWYPVKSLEDKQNYKLTNRIFPDGSAIQLVRLRVLDKRHREEIIFVHFLSSYVRWIIREKVATTILSRDDPWDFKASMSNGEIFTVEITSISEGQQQFIERSREERIDSVASRPTLPFSFLQKLHRDCPNEQGRKIISTAKAMALGPKDEVENPWYGKSVGWISDQPDQNASLFELVRDAINAKAAKAHEGKDQTILIIDNRTTTYELNDFYEASALFTELVTITPFKEVWFYTGYYSDDDGCNAEWSLAPVLLPNYSIERMQESMKQMNMQPNADGIVYGGFNNMFSKSWEATKMDNS